MYKSHKDIIEQNIRQVYEIISDIRREEELKFEILDKPSSYNRASGKYKFTMRVEKPNPKGERDETIPLDEILVEDPNRRQELKQSLREELLKRSKDH
jgi:hypothetical protein